MTEPPSGFTQLEDQPFVNIRQLQRFHDIVRDALVAFDDHVATPVIDSDTKENRHVEDAADTAAIGTGRRAPGPSGSSAKSRYQRDRGHAASGPEPGSDERGEQ